jgi:hypothetical protein
MPKKPTLTVERVPISSLEPDPENARKHSQRNLDAIAKSLDRFGQRRPLVVWGDRIIAGNGTAEAARFLGWDEIDITRVPQDWTQEQARAYALADNRTAEMAEWDGQELLSALESLDGELLAASGFSQEDLDDLEKVWGLPPDLDSLADEIGDPSEEDGLIVVRFKVPPAIHEKWKAALVATGQEDIEAVCLAIQAAYDALTDGEL